MQPMPRQWGLSAAKIACRDVERKLADRLLPERHFLNQLGGFLKLHPHDQARLRIPLMPFLAPVRQPAHDLVVAGWLQGLAWRGSTPRRKIAASPTPFVFLSMSGAFGLSQSRFFFSARISTPALTGAKNWGTTGTSPFQITRPWREPTVVASKRS